MSENHGPLRITRLTEDNFMRVTSLSIEPGDKSIVVIRGPNRAGKTSALRGIISALGGKSYDPETPINESGDEKATVEIILGDKAAERYKVLAKWTPKNRTLDIQELSESGPSRLSKGMTFLNTLINAIAFRPVDFMNATPKAQLEMLIAAIGMKSHYDAEQQRRSQLFINRHAINQRLTSAKAQSAHFVDPSPKELLSPMTDADARAAIAAAETAKKEANEYNQKLVSWAAVTKEKELRLEQIAAQINNLLQDQKNLEAEIKDRKARYEIAVGTHRGMIEKIPDAGDASATIERVSKHNAAVEQQVRARKWAEEIRRLADESDALTEQLSQIDEGLRSIVASSDIAKHVPGVDISAEGEIYLNSLPIGQASGMERLRAACAIGRAINPQFAVLLVDEADCLDPESMKQLETYAAETGTQFWMTANYAGENSDNQLVVPIENGVAAAIDTTSKLPTVSYEKPERAANENEIEAMYSRPGPPAAKGPPAGRSDEFDQL